MREQNLVLEREEYELNKLKRTSEAYGLLALGDRIRVRMQDAAIENTASPSGVITVSGGGSLSNADDDVDGRP